jgi:cell division protein FtsZ
VTVIAAGFDGGMPKRREQAMNQARPQNKLPAAGGDVATQGIPRATPAEAQAQAQQPANQPPPYGTPPANQAPAPAAQPAQPQAPVGQGAAGGSPAPSYQPPAGTPTDDTVPVPNTDQNRGTTHSARPQAGEPVRTAQPTGQPSNQPPVPHPPTPSAPTQHSWPTTGPSNAPSSQPAPQRQPRKPDNDEDDLDIPDFLK